MTDKNQLKQESGPLTGRRTVLKQLGSLGVAASTFSGTAVATTVRHNRKIKDVLGERVSTGKAKKIADNARVRYARQTNFGSWSKAKIDKPTTYYTTLRVNTRIKYVPTAYVFPVTQSSDSVGYLTISARKKWSPVLEASTANPPGSNQQHAKRAARAKGHGLTGRLLYNGGVSYSAEVETRKLAHLGTGLLYETSTDAPKLALEQNPETVESQWSVATRPVTQSVQIQSTEDIISGVPAWDANGGSGYYSGSDPGDKDTSVPDLYGSTGDYWDEWDGCSPFAGAQIIMYHEGISVYDVDQREEIVDRLHILMGTDEEGWTGYLDLDQGINKYPSEGMDHDYTGYAEVLLSKNLFRSEVEANRPFILNIPNNDGWLKSKGPYDGHSVVVYGYAESGSSFDVIHHNSWDTNEHRMQYDNWPINTWVTRVVPS